MDVPGQPPELPPPPPPPRQPPQLLPTLSPKHAATTLQPLPLLLRQPWPKPLQKLKLMFQQPVVPLKHLLKPTPSPSSQLLHPPSVRPLPSVSAREALTDLEVAVVPVPSLLLLHQPVLQLLVISLLHHLLSLMISINVCVAVLVTFSGTNLGDNVDVIVFQCYIKMVIDLLLGY